jgi:hypothetical protein
MSDLRANWPQILGALTSMILAIASAGCGDSTSSGTVVCIDSPSCAEGADAAAVCGDGGCAPAPGPECSGDEDCDDGDACTLGDSCSPDGVCIPGDPAPVPTDACQTCTCTPEAGVVCEPTPLPEDPCQRCDCDPMTGVSCTPLADDDPTPPAPPHIVSDWVSAKPPSLKGHMARIMAI